MLNSEFLITSFLKSALSEEELLRDAYNWKRSILSDPNVAKVIESKRTSPLHILVDGNSNGLTALEVLKKPEVSKVQDLNGDTPLHILAKTFGDFKDRRVSDEILKHPDVGKVENNQGRTPLHILSSYEIEEVKNHPLFDKTKDKSGKTPKDLYGLQRKTDLAMRLIDEPKKKKKKN